MDSVVEDVTFSKKRPFSVEEDEWNKSKKYVRVHCEHDYVNLLHEPGTSNSNKDVFPILSYADGANQEAFDHSDNHHLENANFKSLGMQINSKNRTYNHHDNTVKMHQHADHLKQASHRNSCKSFQTPQVLNQDEHSKNHFVIEHPFESTKEDQEEQPDPDPSHSGLSTNNMYKSYIKIKEYFNDKCHLYFFMIMTFVLIVGSISTFQLLGMIVLPLQESRHQQRIEMSLLSVTLLSTLTTAFSYSWLTSVHKNQNRVIRDNPHVILPSEAKGHDKMKKNELTTITLRQFLSHPDGFHLGLAPSFFGFYVYFGALTAFHENVLSFDQQKKGVRLLPVQDCNSFSPHESPKVLLKSVAGASAGAMAAVLLSSRMNPRKAADFASSMTLGKFADPPGFGGILKGDLFEQIMIDTLKENCKMNPNDDKVPREKCVRLEDGHIPVAVTGFDVLSWKGKILTKGCMAKAARASACFPLLFQPCRWEEKDDDESSTHTLYLIDGALRDSHGLVGLTALLPDEKKKRIVNIVAGSFSGGIIGPSDAPNGLDICEMLSISIENAPQCGPWAMKNGPKAVIAARDAIIAVLDTPLYQGKESGHYVLHIDCKSFIRSK